MPPVPPLTFPSEGLESARDRFEIHAQNIARGRIEAEEIVGLIESQRSFEANAEAEEARDENLGTILDEFA